MFVVHDPVSSRAGGVEEDHRHMVVWRSAVVDVLTWRLLTKGKVGVEIREGGVL